MPPAGFEPAIPADRTATGIGANVCVCVCVRVCVHKHKILNLKS